MVTLAFFLGADQTMVKLNRNAILLIVKDD